MMIKYTSRNKDACESMSQQVLLHEVPKWSHGSDHEEISGFSMHIDINMTIKNEMRHKPWIEPERVHIFRYNTNI